MLEELSNYATIIMALAMVNIVWQLEKASRLFKDMRLILAENLGVKYNERE
ncbi:uncharacterized protein METZ01_LOCUS219922 [marine metagenome]|jgi:hypothetical protein|uniref:Uncharacterized protein n=1 Tax=marine metagenome TaxID=408172 RepID=A0A382FVI8_9ZZZZ|tara:strand:+ start:4489 stop:4641 length:153 start_codon:yes stop_codon:yes gene_type:complete